MLHTPAILLAQSEPWRTEGPRPPRLSAGATPLDMLFEQPLLTAGVAVFLGLVLFFVFNRAGRQRRAIIAAAVALAAAAGLYLAGTLVETEREQVKQRTRALIRAVEAADIAAIEAMLAPSATGAFYGKTVASPRDMLLAKLDDALQRYRVASARISTIEAGSRIKRAAQTRTRVVLRMPDATLYDIPNSAWFLIDWRTDEAGRWVATRIELEMIEGRPELASVRP